MYGTYRNVMNKGVYLHEHDDDQVQREWRGNQRRDSVGVEITFIQQYHFADEKWHGHD